MEAFKLENIKHLHIELTKKCNAYCPSCLRVDSDPQRLNPYVHHNQEVDIELLKEKLSEFPTEQISDVLLCGNEGDPLASKHLNELLSFLKTRSPKIGVQIHTNGSLRQPEFYKELAALMNQPGWFIRFAIDGLEDTNHIYRRGTDFQAIINNATTFIEAGGRADWLWVDFDHNQHQVDQAEELSKTLGFRKFIRRKNTDPNIDFSNVQPRLKSLEKPTAKFEIHSSDELDSYYKNLDKTAYSKINCWALEHSSIYIDSEMQVWPCCWLGQGHLAHNSLEREFFIQRTFKVHGKNFNNLKEHSMDQILSNDFFSKELAESFENLKGDPANACLPKCLSTCGLK